MEDIEAGVHVRIEDVPVVHEREAERERLRIPSDGAAVGEAIVTVSRWSSTGCRPLLGGASFGTHIRRMYDDFTAPQRISHLVIALDPARFVSVDAFKSRMVEMIREVKDTPTVDGLEEVMAPGEIETRTERARLAEGIPLSDALAAELETLGQQYGARM